MSKETVISFTREELVLLAVILLMLVIICVMAWRCKVESERARIYGDFMTNVVLVPKTFILNAQTNYHP